MKDKYHDKPTLSAYVQRQYEPFLRFSADRSGDEQGFPKIPQQINSTEPFYQTILKLSEPYLTDSDVVLDLGCALGRLSAEYAQRARYVVGVDRSEAMIATARRIVTSDKAERVGIPVRTIGNDYVDAYINGWGIADCDFIIADAESLPHGDGQFDFVASVNLLDRSGCPGKVISEMGRVLKPGGRLLVSSPYDWRKEYTPDENEWVNNLKVLFENSGWELLNEVDGIPSLTKVHQRAFSVTLTHMLVLARR